MKILLRSAHNLNLRSRLCFNVLKPFLIEQRKKSDTMKYLNVAEKNDAAKNIALHLSRGTSRRVTLNLSCYFWLLIKYWSRTEVALFYIQYQYFFYFQREGFSQYNKIYEFEADVMGQKCQMVMTSVSGHLLALEFVGAYKNWQSCNPLSLFDAPVFKYCPENYEKIKVM